MKRMEDDDDELFDVDDGAQRDNIYELTIKASDGEFSATHDMTITVTDSPDVPSSGSRSFTINENTKNTVVNAGEENETKYLLEVDGAKASVRLLDSLGNPASGYGVRLHGGRE